MQNKIATVGDLVNLLRTYDQTTPINICYDIFSDCVEITTEMICPNHMNDMVTIDITNIVNKTMENINI